MIAIGSCLVSPLLSHIVRKLPLVQHAPKYAPRLIGLVAYYWHLFLRGSLFFDTGNYAGLHPPSLLLACQIIQHAFATFCYFIGYASRDCAAVYRVF